MEARARFDFAPGKLGRLSRQETWWCKRTAGSLRLPSGQALESPALRSGLGRNDKEKDRVALEFRRNDKILML